MTTSVRLVGDVSKALREYDGKRPYLKQSGHLKFYHAKPLTTVIGEDFGSSMNLGALVRDTSAKADNIIRDLAIRVSECGVCFFEDQDLSYDEQSQLVVRMAHLTGSPKESHLHRQPVSVKDEGRAIEVSNKILEEHGSSIFPGLFANQYWHVDSTFEHVGPAYSCLRLYAAPEAGGDTLWCSLHDCCDKLSPSFLRYLEGLTAEHSAAWYLAFTDKEKLATNRGHPDNSDPSLKATHPVIATHPVTGLKVLNVNRAYTKHINGLTKEESDLLLEYLYRIISDNHDIQVRFHWKANDVALWDNRSTAHCVTNDYAGKHRYGIRSLSSGERATANKKSQTKSQARSAHT